MTVMASLRAHFHGIYPSDAVVPKRGETAVSKKADLLFFLFPPSRNDGNMQSIRETENLHT